jgi:uncharacterized repeat protein (TIGR02543 family)
VGRNSNLNWTVTSSDGWLTLSPVSGTNSGDVTVSINPSGLAAGDYTGTISISAPGTINSPTSIPVTLSVSCKLPVDNWQVVKAYNDNNNSLTGIAFGNETFVAVGDKGAVLTSPNGTDWANHNSGTTKLLDGVAYGNQVFVTGGPAGNGLLTSSDNGANWVSRGYGNNFSVVALAFGNNTFVAAGSTRDGYNLGRILISTDNGVTWIDKSPTNASSFLKVIFGNNTFIALDDTFNLFISHNNGVTWNLNAVTNAWLTTLTYGDNAFYGFDYYSWFMYKSADNGATWNPISANYVDFAAGGFESGGMTYANKNLIAAGCLGSTGYEDVIYSSSDNGSNWIQRYLDPNSYCFSDVTFGKNSFIAVGLGGVIVKSKSANPAISFDPKLLDFGGVTPHTNSASKTITITNAGFSPLSISQIQFNGTDASNFSVVNDMCTTPTNPSLNGSETCTIGVVFNPFSGGSKAAKLSITSNDPVNPTVYVTLSGTGNFTLNLNVIPPNGGTVVSAPAGINCGAGCSASFLPNSPVGLYAAPAPGYVFTGWSGPCTGTDKCSLTMSGDTTVTANFSSGIARIYGTPPFYFTRLADAFNSAQPGDLIQATTNTFVEDLNLNHGIDIIIKGGFDPLYSTNSGVSILQGVLKISSGKLVAEGLVIQPPPGNGGNGMESAPSQGDTVVDPSQDNGSDPTLAPPPP